MAVPRKDIRSIRTADEVVVISHYSQVMMFRGGLLICVQILSSQILLKSEKYMTLVGGRKFGTGYEGETSAVNKAMH